MHDAAVRRRRLDRILFVHAIRLVRWESQLLPKPGGKLRSFETGERSQVCVQHRRADEVWDRTAQLGKHSRLSPVSLHIARGDNHQGHLLGRPASTVNRGLIETRIRQASTWFFAAILVLGLLVLVFIGYERYADGAAAQAYAETVNDVLRAPIYGVTYGLQMYQWQPKMLPLQRNGPLTTTNSYSLEIIPQGSDCSVGSIARVEVVLIGPAFVVEPEQPLVRDVLSLRRNFCVASANASVAKYHWDILARQDGHHVIALHITGLDKAGRTVSTATREVPVVVSDSPFTVSAIVAMLGLVTGLAGIIKAVADYFTNKKRDAQREREAG
jgi:hypothetical protein